MSGVQDDKNEIIKRSEHKPTKGESYIVECLDKYLPKKFEIYIQPILEDNRPDIVLLNQKYGVFIIEVKDWKLERYYKTKDDKGNEHFYKKGFNGEQDKEICSPIEQIQRYHRRLAMYADIDKNKISYAFFFYNSTTQTAKNFVFDDPFIFGDDETLAFVKSFPKYEAKNLQKDEMNRLRKILRPSIHKREYGVEVKLDKQQQNIVEHKPNTWQRARGVAGSGKTFVIAQRAANIASRGLRVLVVCFNKTLKNYIKAQIENAYYDFDRKCIDIFHFHGFLKCFVNENGEDILNGGNFKSWENDALARANKILEMGENCKQRQYDAILIDEAQDFEKEWFDLLIKFLSENNEILLVADDKQNVYEKHISWLVDMKGFVGRWNELKISKRQEDFPDIALKANEFSNLFLKDYFVKNPEKTLGFNLDLTTDQKQMLRGFILPLWENVIEISDEMLYNQIYIAYKYLLQKNINNKDIVILLPNIKMGNEVVHFFINKGIEIEHTFGKDEQERNKNKEKFCIQSNKLKISTIESFKGLEIEAVIYVSDKQNSIKTHIESYIAFTRAKTHLIVLNQNKEYQSCGATWNRFDDEL